jgi:hypothetical protein
MCQPRITSAAISTGYTAQLSPYFVYGDITNAQISTNKDKPTGVIKLGFNRLYNLISIFFFVYLTSKAQAQVFCVLCLYLLNEIYRTVCKIGLAKRCLVMMKLKNNNIPQ